MRLENTPEIFVWAAECGLERCRDLLRMVGIVIDHGDAVPGSLALEPALGSGEIGNSLFNGGHRNAVVVAEGQRREGIQNIMLTRDVQGYSSRLPHTFLHHGEGRMGILVIGNILCAVVGIRVPPECDHPALQPFDEIGKIPDPAVDHQETVLRQKLGKAAEGMADIINILEEIQMIRLHVEDHLCRGMEGQETVGILARLSHKIVLPADADVAADGRKNTPDADCRIHLGNQRRCGGLPVCAGDVDGLIVGCHHLAEKLGPCEHREAAADRARIFRVIRMNGGGIDHHIGVRRYIICSLTKTNLRSLLLQAACQRGFMRIRSAYGKTAAQKDPGDAAHADSSDADKMNMAGLIHADLVH